MQPERRRAGVNTEASGQAPSPLGKPTFCHGGQTCWSHSHYPDHRDVDISVWKLPAQQPGASLSIK